MNYETTAEVEFAALTRGFAKASAARRTSTALDVDFRPDTLARLDAYAVGLGISREQAITNIVGEYLANVGAV